MHEIGREEFEAVVVRAVEGLPAEFRERISNLEFAVEDWAQPDDYIRSSSPPGSTIAVPFRRLVDPLVRSRT